MQQPKLKFNLKEIPEYERNELAKLALAVTEAAFSRDGEEERYQIWLAERNRRLENI